MDIAQAKRILGITDMDDGRTAKIKYRRLIGQYHPDAAGSDSGKQQELAQKINAAYTLLKSEEFFLKKAVSETLWRASINEAAFTERNIYAPYHYWSCICEADRDVGHATMRSMVSNGVAHPWDIDAEGLYQTVTRGKYMWDPDEEEFRLFLRSVYHAVHDILDMVESDCGISGDTDSLRASWQGQLFHCLTMQFVEPAECLAKIAQPEMTDSKGRRIYRFQAYIGEKQNTETIKRIASLQAGETVYPASLQFGKPRHRKSPDGGAERQWRSFSTDRSGSGEAVAFVHDSKDESWTYNSRLMIANKNGETLGHLSFADDELYYCLYPFMSVHLAQIKLTVRNVQKNKGYYNRYAKAGIDALIRLDNAADSYKNPDMSNRIKEILASYKNRLQETV